MLDGSTLSQCRMRWMTLGDGKNGGVGCTITDHADVCDETSMGYDTGPPQPDIN